MLSVSPIPLVLEQRAGGVEFSDLPCLALGRNFNLTSDHISDLRHCCWWLKWPLSWEHYRLCKTTGIWLQLYIRRNNFPDVIKQFTLHLCIFQKYSCEELMEMNKFKLFLILFIVDYIKQVLTPETNNILKYPLDIG